jgi:hypothetical protein
MPRLGSNRLVRIPRFVICTLIAAVLGACGHDPAPERPGYPVFSPNGEPLSGGALGRLDCPAALTRWFERVGQAGRLDRDAFLADARAQFAAMDLDKDGFITPAELAVFRAPYLSGQSAERPAARPDEPAHRPGDARPGGLKPAHDAGDASKSSVRDPSADRPDPVMAADVHLRNEVSLDDFMAHAERTFAGLDTAHAGVLSHEDVLRSCPK